MKQRVTGRIVGDRYEVVYPDGSVMKETALADARQDDKLRAAIERNGWEAIPEE